MTTTPVCQHVINSLKAEVTEDRENYSKCVLMVDEISIKKLQNGSNLNRYVDFGGELGQDSEKVAATALVLMAVGLKKWKMPVSFHFTAGLTTEAVSTD